MRYVLKDKPDIKHGKYMHLFYGGLLVQGNYHVNKMHGNWIRFYSNNQPHIKAMFNMNKAHGKWTKMLIAMEDYAKLWKYDIKGVKIWVKVFCNKKGYIDYIAYSFNPNSKGVDTEIFNKFLNRFLRVYRLDIRSSNHFSHYGRAAFPVKR